HLSDQIEMELKNEYRRKSVAFRVLIFIMMGVFRVNMNQMVTLLNCTKNTMLKKFIALFSKEDSIFEQEISNTWETFKKYKDDIINLTWKIKEQYHKEYARLADSSYIKYIKDFKRRIEYNNVDKLECIDFTKYYPNQIIPIGLKYPDDLMLKAVIYGRMSWYNGTYSLARAVSELWELENDTTDTVIARGLGFYVYVPGKDKFYNYMKDLSEEFVENIMMDFTEILVKNGVIDLQQIIIDSTTAMKRSDDMDEKAKNHKRGSPDQCYKFQFIADASQTPLIIVRRNGEEYDTTGFKKIKDRMLKLKKIANKYNKKIDFFLADAGYFDKSNLKFISESLGAKYIIDINPRRSKNLSKIKKYLNNCKKLISIIYSRKSIKSSDRRKAEITLDSNYLIIYRRRSVIESLFGSLKEYYKIAGNYNNKLRLKSGEKIGVFALLICIGLQIHSITKYRLLKDNIRPIRSLYTVRLSELILNYEKEE
ncbi:MAG: transposase, partial [Candidatus Helarchaeota archaeon]